MPNAYWLSCVCRCLLVTLDGMSSAWSTTSPATFVRSSRVSAWWCTWECSTFCGGPSAWSTFWRWSGKNRWRVPGCFVHCLVCCFHEYMLLILARRLHSFSLFVCYFVPVRGVSTAISMSLRPSAHNRMKFSVHVTCGHGSVHRSAMHYVLLVLWMTSCVHIMEHMRCTARLTSEGCQSVGGSAEMGGASALPFCPSALLPTDWLPSAVSLAMYTIEFGCGGKQCIAHSGVMCAILNFLVFCFWFFNRINKYLFTSFCGIV